MRVSVLTLSLRGGGDSRTSERRGSYKRNQVIVKIIYNIFVSRRQGRRINARLSVGARARNLLSLCLVNGTFTLLNAQATLSAASTGRGCDWQTRNELRIDGLKMDGGRAHVDSATRGLGEGCGRGMTNGTACSGRVATAAPPELSTWAPPI